VRAGRGVRQAVTMACLLAAVTGCATAAKSRQNTPPMNHRAAAPEEQTRTVRIYFGAPLGAPKAGHVVSAPEQHIRDGLARFEEHRYELAAREFEAVQEELTESQSELNRSCLISAAVCRLLADDPHGFARTVASLKQTYRPEELGSMEWKDPRVKALLELYDRLQRQGNL